jgi:hypothetical protein
MLRGRGFASDGTANVVHTPQGGITSRWGSKTIAPQLSAVAFGPYAGLTAFSTTDLQGNQKTEILGCADRAYKLTQGSFVITNSNAAAATVNHFYEEAISAFRFKITRGGSDIVSVNCGLGTEGSPIYLSDIETTVDAASNLAMSTPTNASTTPAAFMELLNGSTIAGSGGTLTIYYWYWEAVATVTDSSNKLYVSGGASTFGTDAYRSLSTAVVSNVLYFTSPGIAGSSSEYYLLKYDGNRIYRAGCPRAIHVDFNFAALSVAAGVKTDDVRGSLTVALPGADLTSGYKYRYVNVDKAGNRIEGTVAQRTASPATADQIMFLRTVTAVDPNWDGKAFNNVYARANGTQSNVLQITVTNPHTLQAGDVAYFWDANQVRFIQRVITATTSTTITISSTSLDSDRESINYDVGGSVFISTGALITNNSRIAIYRTAASGGTTWYLLAEVPNWQVTGVAANPGYYDATADTTIAGNAPLIEDEFPHDPPPTNCAHVAAYNSGLVLSGNTQKPNRVFFSDTDGPEYFPAVTHNFDVEAPVTGHRQSGEFLVVGTLNLPTLTVVSGVLSDFTFRPDKIGSNIGVTSHLSMQEIEEGVLCFSSNVGPYVLFSGRRLEPLGALTYPDGAKVSRLEPYWTRRYTATETKPVFKRAIAAVLPNDKLYLLWIPTEDPAYPGFASGGTVFAFDYGRGAWWPWTGLNMAGGMAVMDGVLYWTSLYQVSGNRRSYAWQMQRGVALDEYRYADHNAAIDFKYRSHWESLGEPAKFKRFLRCRVSSHETRATSSCSVDLNTYVDYSTANTSNDDTLTFTTQQDLKPKLKAETCRALMVEFASTTRYNPPIISAYELEATSDFRAEMKE